jgi:aerobic-type carbon monoxide dehydrogenase small subunit (CoxS/CutS family)
MKVEEQVMRVDIHPILGEAQRGNKITLLVNGEAIEALEGEPIAAALLAAGRRVFRYTTRTNEPRGVFCALGRCTDCVMVVDGRPNVRTCVTLARDGMVIETQKGLGSWAAEHNPEVEEE